MRILAPERLKTLVNITLNTLERWPKEKMNASAKMVDYHGCQYACKIIQLGQAIALHSGISSETQDVRRAVVWLDACLEREFTRGREVKCNEVRMPFRADNTESLFVTCVVNDFAFTVLRIV